MYHSLICLQENVDFKQALQILKEMHPLSGCGGREHWVSIEHPQKLSVDELQILATKLEIRVDQIAPRNILFPDMSEWDKWDECITKQTKTNMSKAKQTKEDPWACFSPTNSYRRDFEERERESALFYELCCTDEKGETLKPDIQKYLEETGFCVELCGWSRHWITLSTPTELTNAEMTKIAKDLGIPIERLGQKRLEEWQLSTPKHCRIEWLEA